MKIETVEYLWPSEGKWLTDGKACYSAVKLGKGRSADEFWEINDEERISLFPEEVTEEISEDVDATKEMSDEDEVAEDGNNC